jgi:hypothetical protein
MEKFIDTQEWVPIHTLPGFEACIEYYVNRKGQIKSTKYREDRILKWRKHKAGYPMICLTQRIGKQKPLDVCIHKLVAFAFLPPPPRPYGKKKDHCIIDHIDEDKMNCSADNLRWVTWKENNTKFRYNRRPKNTPEEDEAYKERQKISKREHMRRKRAEEKKAKIEESAISN